MSHSLRDRDLRQRDLVPPDKLSQYHALVIGVGAIGRQVSLQLAAKGIPAMTLIDPDTVEIVNLAVQGYLPEDLGQSKVSATSQLCRRINPQLLIQSHAERFGRSSVKTLPCFSDFQRKLVVFVCVDDINTRGNIWEWIKYHVAFFADARMGGEVIRVLASTEPLEELFYPYRFFQLDQAFTGSCSAKSTIFTASIAAGLTLSQFSRWLRELPVDHDLVLNLLASEITVS